MVTSVRHANLAEGTYTTCSYAIMLRDTNHLLMVNPTERPFQIRKDELVGMYESVMANTPFTYFNSPTAVFCHGATMTPLALTSLTNAPGTGIPTVNCKPTTMTSWTPERKTPKTNSF